MGVVEAAFAAGAAGAASSYSTSSLSSSTAQAAATWSIAASRAAGRARYLTVTLHCINKQTKSLVIEKIQELKFN